MNNTDANLMEIHNYIKELKNFSVGYTPSLFWEKQLEDLKKSNSYANIETLKYSDIEHIITRLGYGFTCSVAGGARCDTDYIESYDLMCKLDEISQKISMKHFDVAKDKWEHACALYFLQRHKILDNYIDFISSLSIKSDMSTARHYYYALLIRNFIESYLGSEPVSICEIGAGAGNLAFFLSKMGCVRNYCIVDLPEMLINSSTTIYKHLSQAKIRFNQKFDEGSGFGDSQFWFYVPQHLDMLKDKSFDLCLNFNSFMEMDKDARDSYIKTIYRVGKNDSLFINVNRRQKSLPNREGTFFDNNPLLYPYDPEDIILMWEEDEFQQATRSQFGSVPVSYAIIRASIVNPTKRSGIKPFEYNMAKMVMPASKTELPVIKQNKKKNRILKYLRKALKKLKAYIK
ncbi:MAG: putative sugar O-methyltransferase [Candidatus Auribacterota bacterium]|jgi:putative sugar O-methyltransferase|nr:putative sugar O-methyltransferase [Candidatus Auribacterota bacterium]